MLPLQRFADAGSAAGLKPSRTEGLAPSEMFCLGE